MPVITTIKHRNGSAKKYELKQFVMLLIQLPYTANVNQVHRIYILQKTRSTN